MLTNVIQSYPYPVAHPYSVVFDENQTPQTRVWALHFTTYQALKVICLPVVSQYLTDQKETVDKGRAYVSSALESFLKELAAEEWTPGSVSEGFQQCVQGLVKQGAELLVAIALYNVGFELMNTRYAPSAETALTATRDIFGNIFPYFAIPKDIAVAKMAASTYRNLGMLHIQSGHAQEAEEELMWAIKVQERLCSEEPEDVEVSNNLALFLSTLGGIYLQSERVQEAEAIVKRAIEIQERLYRENPEEVYIANNLALFLVL